MTETIYVRLLDEGVSVLRPVQATKISTDKYKIENGCYYSSVEHRQFIPGDIVVLMSQMVEGQSVLVAIASA